MSSDVDFARSAPGATGVDRDHLAAAHLTIIDADAGRVDWFSGGRRSIALCGFAGGSRARMPLDQADWIIVGLNQLYRHLPRMDATFDIHADWRAGNVEGTDHEAFLRDCGMPVFMVEPEASLPTAVRNPKRQLDDYFGTDYATSTVAHMLRLFIYEIEQDVVKRLTDLPHAGASLEGARTLIRKAYGEYRIGIFGVDLIVGSEYEQQKACVEFWIGEAEARGIVVEIPPESALLKQAFCYGYETEPAAWPFRQSEHAARHAALLAQRADLERAVQEKQTAILQLTGALREEEMLMEVATLRARGGRVAMPMTEA